MSKRVFIVAAQRTPIGGFGGSLSSLSAAELGSKVVAGLLERTKIDVSEINDILMGCVLQAGVGQAPARQVAKLAGIPDHVSATTVNKVCASGMKAVSLAAQSILLGDAEVVVAGGMESMSQVPYYVPATRWGAKYGAQPMLDGIQRDGLSDAYSQDAMGFFAELCAEKYAIDRDAQDAYATLSYRRSAAAWQAGKFQDEVLPISIKSRKGEQLVATDEEFSQVDFARLAQLKPAFKEGGTVTAANASTLSDGAAALLLVSEAKLIQLGLTPLAEIVSYADAEQAPAWFTTTPYIAAKKALEKANLPLSAIDYAEFNEAFSVVALANAQLLDIPLEKINVYGGAVSLGHPLGCSGARILTTLISVLQQEGGTYGLAAICNGGGGASAMILRRVWVPDQ